MKTVRKYTGRYVMPVKALPRRLALTVLVCTPLAMAQALPPLGAETNDVLVNEASSAWSQTLLGEDAAWLPLDEQIFTAISPIVDAPEGVKLPEDQQVED